MPFFTLCESIYWSKSMNPPNLPSVITALSLPPSLWAPQLLNTASFSFNLPLLYWSQLINNVVLFLVCSKVSDSDKFLYTQIYIYIYIYILIYVFQILVHYNLLPDVECTSLCHRAGPCCLCTVLHVWWPQAPDLPPSPLVTLSFFLCVWTCSYFVHKFIVSCCRFHI